MEVCRWSWKTLKWLDVLSDSRSYFLEGLSVSYNRLSHSMSTIIIKGSASMILARSIWPDLSKGLFMISRWNSCRKWEPYQCGVPTFYFYLTKRGEFNQTFYKWKNGKHWWNVIHELLICWSIDKHRYVNQVNCQLSFHRLIIISLNWLSDIGIKAIIQMYSCFMASQSE